MNLSNKLFFHSFLVISVGCAMCTQSIAIVMFNDSFLFIEHHSESVTKRTVEYKNKYKFMAYEAVK